MEPLPNQKLTKEIYRFIFYIKGHYASVLSALGRLDRVGMQPSEAAGSRRAR